MFLRNTLLQGHGLYEIAYSFRRGGPDQNGVGSHVGTGNGFRDAASYGNLRSFGHTVVNHFAGNFRTIRFGIAEPHGRGEMMEFNFMMEQGAVARDDATGRYAVVLDKMPETMAALAKELLEQEATGDRARTAAWFAKYAMVPDHLQKAFAKVSDIPVDIQPIYSFPEDIR